MPNGTREGEGRYRVLGVVPREGEVVPEREPEDTVFTWPHLLVRHAVVAGAVVAITFAVGIAFDAPLQEMANPNLTPRVAKAPWYFAGLQELLAHFHPVVAGILQIRGFSHCPARHSLHFAPMATRGYGIHLSAGRFNSFQYIEIDSRGDAEFAELGG